MAAIHSAMLHKVILSTCLFVLLLACTPIPDMKTDGGIKVMVELDAEGYSKAALERARAACMEIFQKRLENKYGYSPNIFADSDPSRIRIEVAGARNEQALVQLLTRSANLRFCETFTFAELAAGIMELFESDDPRSKLGSLHVGAAENSPVVGYAMARDTAQINKFLSGQEAMNIFGSSVQFLWGAKACNPEREFELYAVRANGNRKEELWSKIIEQSDVFEENGRVSVSVQFTEHGAQEWAAFTNKNKMRYVAIALDKQVYSCPMVLSEITSGETVISGSFTLEEAKDLSSLLNVGSLPVGVRIASMKKVRGKGK